MLSADLCDQISWVPFAVIHCYTKITGYCYLLVIVIRETETERERERGGERDRETERKRDSETGLDQKSLDSIKHHFCTGCYFM
jgi:hypothetical protein